MSSFANNQGGGGGGNGGRGGGGGGGRNRNRNRKRPRGKSDGQQNAQQQNGQQNGGGAFAPPSSNATAPAPLPPGKNSSTMKFTEVAGICDARRRALASMRFEYMTEVQAQTLPVCLSGVDTLAKAKTGTGKTLAFLVPALEIIARERRNARQRGEKERGQGEGSRHDATQTPPPLLTP